MYAHFRRYGSGGELEAQNLCAVFHLHRDARRDHLDNPRGDAQAARRRRCHGMAEYPVSVRFVEFVELEQPIELLRDRGWLIARDPCPVSLGNVREPRIPFGVPSLLVDDGPLRLLGGAGAEDFGGLIDDVVECAPEVVDSIAKIRLQCSGTRRLTIA